MTSRSQKVSCDGGSWDQIPPGLKVAHSRITPILIANDVAHGGDGRVRGCRRGRDTVRAGASVRDGGRKERGRVENKGCGMRQSRGCLEAPDNNPQTLVVVSLDCGRAVDDAAKRVSDE
nr:hypothetical protein CFP56_62868 [Quercus suber]